jgi:Icc-related predicted phosphoesterase
MTRIKHVSDTHGKFPRLMGNFDIVVHSGDFCPNFVYGINTESYHQEVWLKSKIAEIEEWTLGKPLYFVLGNHDYISPAVFEATLRAHKIEAYDLTDKIVTHAGLNFYGFPYVPPINGKYAYELNAEQMAERIDAMVAVGNSTYIDVIVAHCPPAGCLDLCFNQHMRFGNSGLSNGLDYKFSKDMLPSALLVGHIHTSHGITMRNGVLVSNAATSQYTLEL